MRNNGVVRAKIATFSLYLRPQITNCPTQRGGVARECVLQRQKAWGKAEMGKYEMVDTFGVPEFYADHIGAIEDLGNGMIRVIKCTKRQGVLVPVYSFVAPAVAFLADGAAMRNFATQIVNPEGKTAH